MAEMAEALKKRQMVKKEMAGGEQRAGGRHKARLKANG